MTKLLALALATGAFLPGQTPKPGRWDGVISLADLKVPFSIELSIEGSVVSGAFYNDAQRTVSTGGSLAGGVLKLDFAQHATHLEAKLSGDTLKGTYGGERFGRHPFEAVAFCTCGDEGEAGPDIAGAWKVEGAMWNLPVQRKGEETVATLKRDNGKPVLLLTGRFDGLQFNLKHFDGSRAALLEIAVGKDGSLDLSLKEPGQPAKTYRAIR